MSTADGAILAMGTVFSHNLVRQLDPIFPGLITNANLLKMARLSTIPWTIASASIAAFYQSSRPSGATGYLLIVAFDVVLATAVVPLVGCFYASKPRPNAAFVSILCGAAIRIILEFTLPKDGYLLLPYDQPEFLNYGVAASVKLPTFVDGAKNETWNPSEETCDQVLYKDFTGVDSITAFITSVLVYVFIQFLEHKLGRPLFELPGLEPYNKNAVEAVAGVDESVSKETRHTQKLTEDDSNDGLSKPKDEIESPSPETEVEGAQEVGVIEEA